jgi:hypothetical protein
MTYKLTGAVLFLLILSWPGTSLGQAPNRRQASDGPWNHDLYHFETDSTGEFGSARVLVERGGVPALLRDQWSRLVATFQWFPFERREAFDRIAVMFSYDDGETWGKPQPIKVAQWPEGYVRPCDPTLVQVEDGRYRLYFTSSGPGERSPATYSAVSNDAIHFTFEPGRRFGVDGEMVLDCAITRLGKTWHYFAPIQRESGRGYHAVSEDGLTFERLDDVTVPGDRQWLGCVIATERGLRFFGSGRAGAWSAVSADGSKWRIEEIDYRTGADPCVAATDTGRYVMIATGPRRADSERVSAPFPPIPAGIGTQGPPPPFESVSASTDAALGQPSRKPDLAMYWSGGRAVGRGPVTLTNFPLRVEDIASICPMGLMVGGHVTPSNHLGVAQKDRNAAPDRYDVLAIADGFIVQVQRAPGGNPDPSVRGQRTGEYKIVFEHSGTFWSYIGLIDRLDERIIDALGEEPRPGPPVNLRLPVKGGDMVGKLGGGHGLDFAVINTEVTLDGFVRPEQFYNRDPFKTHTVDPFDYVDEPLRSRLLALNARRAAPLGGKIDYDIDGRLVGNWYKQGTGGYAGFRGQLDYWLGHLAIVYHHIDPTKITVSIGDFGGQVRQYWVKDNSPDPAKVSIASGRVRYELVYAKIGSAGQTYEGIPAGVQGVLLVELIEDRKLRVEAFPGKVADEVDGFTKAAAIYER